jgi:TRAP-type C4-dicarboxylate transport system substrate-binding protein
MKKVKIFLLTVLAFLITLSVGFNAQAAAIEIKSACFLPATHSIGGVVPSYVAMINKACGVTIKWKHLGGPEVLPGLEQFGAVKRGVLDASFLVTAYYFGEVPDGYCVYLSEISNEEEWNNGARDLIDKIHQEKGIKVLGRWLSYMPFYIWVNKPVKKPQDLKGIKLRGGGICYDPFFKALGVTPVQIPPPDTYNALERGIIGGFGWPMQGVSDFGWVEVTKYCIEHPFYEHNNGLILMNLDKWNSLPKDAQKTIMRATRAWESDMEAYHKAEWEKYRKKFIEAGGSFIKFSEADADYYKKLAYEEPWKFQKAKSDRYYDELRRLLTK